jgi:DNA-binding PadR family transcriptional regulator
MDASAAIPNSGTPTARRGWLSFEEVAPKMKDQRSIGLAEARILSVLFATATIVEIVKRLEDELDDAAVYLALKRLTDRGLVTRRTVTRRASDGKMRDLGEYTPTPEAFAALEQFKDVAQRIFAQAALAP